MKFTISKKTRASLSSLGSELTFREKLLKSHAIDLNNNMKIKPINNNYAIVEPINPNKHIK